MKLFWKIFLSTMSITIFTFTAGGYVLIHALFASAMNREIQAAYRDNEALRSAFESSVLAVPYNGSLNAGVFWDVADKIEISTSEGPLSFCISNESYELLYSNMQNSEQNDLLEALKGRVRGYVLLEKNGRYFIRAGCPVLVEDQRLYLENEREVTSVFQTKREQFQIFQWILVFLIGIMSLLLFGVSYWLTSPLKALSKAVKRIAEGNFEQRLVSRSQDEIGMLSRDFQVMADHLEQKIKELEDNARQKEDFVGSFAHELKTPLTSMIGYADMLRSKKMSEEDRFLAANYIFEEGKRLESMSFKLLEMTVLKKKDFPMRQIHTRDFMESIQRAVRPVLEKEQIQLLVSVEDAVLTAEPDLLKTVFFNLIDNAKKAMDQGGHIYFAGKRVQSGYAICVQDTGRGMPKEELSRITEAFYMVDKSRAREKGGAGLGLSICQEIVDIHHGELHFNSELGKGTFAAVVFREGVS